MTRENSMTAEPAGNAQEARTPSGEIALDGLFTGMIGALIVVAWFLAIDLARGQALYTPALLGSVLLHGGGAASQPVVVAPLEVATYTAFHFVSFLAVGLVLSYLTTLLERLPIIFFLILVLFLGLQVAFFVLDAALGAQLIGRLQPWSVLIANLLAAIGMGLYQWKRHPRALRKIDALWEDDS